MSSDDPFACLSHEIFKYWVAKFIIKEKGKTVSIDVKEENEYIIFFKVDNGYISSSNKRGDYLAYYHDFNNERKYLLFIEFKGSDVRDAIRQLKATIDNDKIKRIFNTFKGVKGATIISHGASPNYVKEEIKRFRKTYGIPLKIFHKKALI